MVWNGLWFDVLLNLNKSHVWHVSFLFDQAVSSRSMEDFRGCRGSCVGYRLGRGRVWSVRLGGSVVAGGEFIECGRFGACFADAGPPDPQSRTFTG